MPDTDLPPHVDDDPPEGWFFDDVEIRPGGILSRIMTWLNR